MIPAETAFGAIPFDLGLPRDGPDRNEDRGDSRDLEAELELPSN
jgi:hypothetical protein